MTLLIKWLTATLLSSQKNLKDLKDRKDFKNFKDLKDPI